MIASDGTQREVDTENGLIQGQSLEVVSVHEFYAQNRELIRLVKLKTPLGATNDWTGEWSEMSDKWTPDLRKRLGYTSSRGQEDIFFMPFEEYIEIYKRTSIISEPAAGQLQAHSQVKCTFTRERTSDTTKPAFFRFFLERDIDLSQETLTVSVH